jgi:multiple sugar transport system ATP-binding protein
VQVELVEALGNDTYLTVSLAGVSHPLRVRVSPDRLVRIGEQIWLAIAPDKIHLFEPRTSKAIRLDR